MFHRVLHKRLHRGQPGAAGGGCLMKRGNRPAQEANAAVLVQEVMQGPAGHKAGAGLGVTSASGDTGGHRGLLGKP